MIGRRKEGGRKSERKSFLWDVPASTKRAAQTGYCSASWPISFYFMGSNRLLAGLSGSTQKGRVNKVGRVSRQPSERQG